MYNKYKMNKNNGMNQGYSINPIMDMMKAQMMSMMILNNNNNNKNDTYSSIYNMIVFFIIEKVMSIFPELINIIKKIIDSYILYNKENIEKKMKTINTVKEIKEKTSSIIMEINLSLLDEISCSVIDYITSHENTKSILFKDKLYILNYKNVILLNDEEQIYSILLKSDIGQTKETTNQTIEIYSYKLNMNELRNYINNIVIESKRKLQNKLGNKLYCFNEIPCNAIMINSGGNEIKDYSRLPQILTFKIKPFYTNKKFSNIFGDECEMIKNRVNFFKNNKKWYEDKGIPYTLGLLLSGQSGAGKTSTIKSIANETNRHIININFHNDLTKTQLENLFFDENIMININGKSESVNIPIDKRLYILEDIDCQNNIILDRSKNDNYFRKTNHDTYYNNDMDSNKLTLSYLLNLLDGVLETPGRILIMTSNYPDELDHALVRPGRIDLICNFKKCVNKVIIEFIEKYYEIKLDENYINIIKGFKEYQWSPSEISKILFENFEDYKNAINYMINSNELFLENNELNNIENNELNNIENEKNNKDYMFFKV